MLIVSAAYAGWHLRRGWTSWDDGTLAQSAERVTQGQLSHRDFDDVYTGGLALLDAAAFRLLSPTLWTLRLVVLAAFLAWVPAVFYIASRFVRPRAAAGVALLAVAWSLPNYALAMPSWYNLFLATFGVGALLRYLEDGRRRWLVAAGVVGGLSFLVKVIGLYYVAGVLLFLVFHAHERARRAAGAAPARARGYAAFVSAALVLFVAALFSIVRRQLHAPEVVQFVVPGVFVAGLLVRNEWTQPVGTSRVRFADLARLLVPFLAGVVLPVVLFLVPYAQSGALGAFVNGVFVLPMRRFGIATYRALPLTTMLALVPFAALVAWEQRNAPGIGRRETTLLAIALALVLGASGMYIAPYRLAWYAARSVLPVLVIGGVFLLARIREADARSLLLREQTMLLLTVTALCSLVQFPFAAPIYFCYIAPLVVLSAVALHAYVRLPVRTVPTLLGAFFAAFAVLRIAGSPLYGMGVYYTPPLPMAALSLERAGIEIPQIAAVVYDSLIPRLRAHARGGYTWASPDTPEIYFLAGLRNPTRSLFEMFDDTSNRDDRLLRALAAHSVTAIVLNAQPSFSPPIPQELFEKLAARYPYSENIAPFQLRWRD